MGICKAPKRAPKKLNQRMLDAQRRLWIGGGDLGARREPISLARAWAREWGSRFEEAPLADWVRLVAMRLLGEEEGLFIDVIPPSRRSEEAGGAAARLRETPLHGIHKAESSFEWSLVGVALPPNLSSSRNLKGSRPWTLVPNLLVSGLTT